MSDKPMRPYPGDGARSSAQAFGIKTDMKFKVYEDNPILRTGREGQWDAGALGTMSVLKVDGVFHMYYEAWGERSGIDWVEEEYYSLQIGHATSPDGIHWAKDPANPVLRSGTEGEWDHHGTWDPFVLHEDGLFKMWHGGGANDYCDWAYATSEDGTTFTKHGKISAVGNVEDIHIVPLCQNSCHLFLMNLHGYSP